MIIAIRHLQSFLNASAKEVNQLIVPLLSLSDLFNYYPFSPIRIQHFPGSTNPADALTKPVPDTYISQFLSDRSVCSEPRYIEVDSYQVPRVQSFPVVTPSVPLQLSYQLRDRSALQAPMRLTYGHGFNQLG
jgi:hypothetical protein